MRYLALSIAFLEDLNGSCPSYLRLSRSSREKTVSSDPDQYQQSDWNKRRDY